MKTVGITYDAQPVQGRVPAPGDFLLTMGKRGPATRYEIVEAREVRRRAANANAVPRFALRCRRLAHTGLPHGGGVVWFMFWYRRKRSRAG